MSASDYDLLKKKLDEIIATSERFPESVRELIRRSLVESLLQERDFGQTIPAHEQRTGPAVHQSAVEESSVIDHESATAFSQYFKQYKGIKLNDMEFCALVARFFTRELSPEKPEEFIGPELLMAAVAIAGRPRRPANPATTLNNAKNFGEFLESKGKGLYAISEHGIKMLDENST